MTDVLPQHVLDKLDENRLVNSWVDALMQAKQYILERMGAQLPGQALDEATIWAHLNQIAPHEPVLASAVMYTLKRMKGSQDYILVETTPQNQTLLHLQFAKWRTKVLEEHLPDTFVIGWLNGIDPESEHCAKTLAEGDKWYSLICRHQANPESNVFTLEYKNDGKCKDSSHEARVKDRYGHELVCAYGCSKHEAHEELVKVVQRTLGSLHSVMLNAPYIAPETDEERDKRLQARRW